MSQVRYFIPEDGDTEQAPNVFLAPKPSRQGYPPLLGQIKAAFPLPGKYHFRFKTTLVQGYDKGPVVWMDAVDNNEPIPVLQNVILAKVTRIAFGTDEEDTEEEDEFRVSEMNAYQASRSKEPARSAPPMPSKNAHPYARSAPPSVSNTPSHTPRSTPPPQPVHAGGEADLLGNAFGDGGSTAGHGSSTRTRSTGGGLLDGYDDGTSAGPSAASASNPDTLLDMSHPPAPTVGDSSNHDFFGGSTSHAQPNPASASSHHNDFLGMHAPVPTPQAQPTRNNMMNGSTGGYGNMGQKPAQRQQQPPTRQTSAPSSGNSKQSNAFDSFSKNTSPFADFGNFA